MPELPEVETIARDLQAKVAGSVIAGVQVSKSDVLRVAGPRVLARRTTGARILRSWRRAKLVVLDLSTGDRLVVSLRFTGALLVDDGTLTDEDRRYSTVRWALEDGRILHYREVRRLGTVSLMTPRQFDAYVSRLGVEPLEPAFTPSHFFELLRTSRQAVKKRIMDQRAVVGIGNIYANEALWRARIDPSRSAHKITRAESDELHAAIVDVLTDALRARGTSFRDYRDSSGQRGGFVTRLAAYGREGQPCLRCGARLVGTHEIDGRATVLCARCQH
ncbi:MAG TPA: bifunctional DNA-formamidopyrimidine glycosylase/DNA-(apurinic or apyrimidinic site) lyase [Gemmatimonadaceae bacterium]|nr:bifunctional DNA-formamidopyrimidine glycosylase/DNA-(apurinic or apyrimidinic site) lyase [Gemmatimonadaceae bacterium]